MDDIVDKKNLNLGFNSKIDENKKGISKFLIMNIKGKNFCLNLEVINEIVLSKNITPVPNTPDNFLGIINLRGDIIPIVNMEMFFNTGKSDSLYRLNSSCIIVLKYDKYVLGIIVDANFDMLDVLNEDIIFHSGNNNDYLGFIKIGEETFFILNHFKFFNF